MRQVFIPSDFQIPKKVELGNYFLIPISTKNVAEDLEVLTNNAEAIVRQRGGGESKNRWPYKFTLEENYKDLAWLETCANLRQLFVYVLRDKKNNNYVGCVYIYPIELFYPNLAKKYDVDFSFWIVQSEFNRGTYDEIFKKILTWLIQNWPFKRERIFLRNKLIPEGLT